MESVKIIAPATIANLVCGFDILGLAINNPRDIMEVQLREEPGIVIHHKDEHRLPEDPSQNVAGVALMAMLEEVDNSFFFSSRRRHTRFKCDWSSDVCSSDLSASAPAAASRTACMRSRSEPT